MARSAVYIVAGVAALLLSAVAPAIAQPQDSYSLESIAQVPASELAERLLGADIASDVEAVEIQDLGLIEQLSGVRFFHRPQPISDDICGRRFHYIDLHPAAAVDPATRPRQVRVRAEGVTEGMQIALAPGCRLAPGQSFAYLNPGLDVAAGAAALRNLAAARAAAAAAGDLPFRLECLDTTRRGACRGDGRSALAELRPEQAWLLQTAPGPAGGVTIIVGEPGQQFWEVRAARFGTDLAELVIARKVPTPF